MHNINIRNKALAIRKGGSTIRDIAKELNISFSIVSFWCKNIKLRGAVIDKMKFQRKEKSIRGLLRYSERKRKQRIEDTLLQKKSGIKMLGKLSNRDMLMVGTGLYWGEGYKESNGEFGFTNSNPDMIKFYLRWLKIFDIPRKDLIFRLSLNGVFKNQEKVIKNFWIKYLNIKENQFSKTTFIKTKLKKAFVRKGNNYRGILRVKVRRGLALKNKILGAIEYLSKI